MLLVISSACKKDANYTGKLLSKVDFGYHNVSLNFMYNNDGSLKQIKRYEDTDYSLHDFTYVNKKISTVKSTWYQGNGLNTEIVDYQFTYSDQITTITETYESDNYQEVRKFYKNSSDKIYKITWSNQESDTEEDLLTWSNNNVTEINNSYNNALSYKITYQYDDKKNPYSLLSTEVLEWLYNSELPMDFYIMDVLFSSNNMTKSWHNNYLKAINTYTYDLDNYLSTITIPATPGYYPIIKISFEYK